MKKFLVMLLIATTLVGCNGNKVNNDGDNPSVTIVDTDEQSSSQVGNFGDIEIKQISKEVFVEDVDIDDSLFPEIIARGFYLSVLDYKYFIHGKDQPSTTFVDYEKGVVTTPINNEVYTIEKKKVSFDDAMSVQEGIDYAPVVEADSMPIVKYVYSLNDVCDLSVVISQIKGYEEESDYTITFTLTAVGSDEYITTTVISDGNMNLNEALYIGAFINEPYKTVNMILNIVNDKYVTDTAYNEVLNFEQRLDKNVAEVSELANTLELDKYEVVYYPYVASEDVINASLSYADANTDYEALAKYLITDEIDVVFKNKEKETEVVDGKKLLTLPLPIDEAIDAIAENKILTFYSSYAKVQNDFNADIRLYFEPSSKENLIYIVASDGDNTFITQYTSDESQEILSIIFDLMGKAEPKV